MVPHVEEHILQAVDTVRDRNDVHRNTAERHMFRTIEQIGKRDTNGERKQRIVAIVISLMICTGLYGVLYLAMHLQG
jgi:hypothetical protein